MKAGYVDGQHRSTKTLITTFIEERFQQVCSLAQIVVSGHETRIRIRPFNTKRAASPAIDHADVPPL